VYSVSISLTHGVLGKYDGTDYPTATFTVIWHILIN